MPVGDTLKRANRETRVAATEPRDGMWLAQTPQMFRYRLLIEALRAADPAVVTDEARAVEGLGLKPKLVMGDTRNLKVTYTEDLEIATLILESRNVGDVRKKLRLKKKSGPPRRQGAGKSRIQTRKKKK